MCSRNLAKERAKNICDDANRVLNYLLVGDVEKAKFFLTDIKESVKLIEEVK